MVATFAWQWCSEYNCDTETWPDAVCRERPFKAMTHPSRHYTGSGLDEDDDGREPWRGYVYEFRNEHDGSYLTVVQAPGDARFLQFQTGNFEFDDASEDGLCSNTKKRGPNDVSIL